jgi:ADP-ribosyl-[dinitrogen reductase] hydrolase
VVERPNPNTHWIAKGKLLAGQFAGGFDPDGVTAELARFLDAGVRHFVDLTEPGEMGCYTEALAGLAKAQGLTLTYQHFPLRNAEVPGSAATMRQMLDAIELAMAQDGVTYVHCWGGRGRTGLAVACWLQEQGRTTDEALAELTRAWQQNGRWSEGKCSSPETDAQEDWVRSWPHRRANLVSLHDRYRGALLGLAAGDALGTTLEFKRPGTFTPLMDMVGGGPFGLRPGQWTDDTSMALCLAESLVECQGFDPRDQMERYLRWYHDGHLSSTGSCFDIGITTRKALKRFEATSEPFAGSTDPYTAGNGSIMRLAPVALYYRTAPEQRALGLAADSSRTTHGARTAVDGCRYLAALLRGALQGKPKEALLSVQLEGLAPEVAEVAAGSFRRKQPPQIRGTGYVVESLEAALWAFAGTGSFAEGALAAANLGDDADTTGAVYGQLAGVYYGAGAIPKGWLAKLAMRETIEGLADRLWLSSLPRLGSGS